MFDRIGDRTDDKPTEAIINYRIDGRFNGERTETPTECDEHLSSHTLPSFLLSLAPSHSPSLLVFPFFYSCTVRMSFRYVAVRRKTVTETDQWARGVDNNINRSSRSSRSISPIKRIKRGYKKHLYDAKNPLQGGVDLARQIRRPHSPPPLCPIMPSCPLLSPLFPPSERKRSGWQLDFYFRKRLWLTNVKRKTIQTSFSTQERGGGRGRRENKWFF